MYGIFEEEKKLSQYQIDWINALQSGDYKQTKASLKNNLGFCCLGVYCDLRGDEWTEGDLGSFESYAGDEQLNDELLLGNRLLGELDLTADEQDFLAQVNDASQDFKPRFGRHP